MGQNFDYYYGSQADQFSFIRIPRVMLTEETFAALSLPSKVLYGVLLDRMSLSRKNSWFDEENRVYIIYQIGEIMEDLGFSRKKAMELLSELEKFGLLVKKRRGHGLPNILYVKNFMPEDSHSVHVEGRASPASPVTAGSRHDNSGTSAPSRPVSRCSCQVTSGGDNKAAAVPGPSPHEVPDRSLHDVPISGPLKSYTEYNQTDMNHIVSYHTSGTVVDSRQEESIRCDEMRSDMTPSTIAFEYRQLILENIEFEYLLKAHPNEADLLEGIVDLILETVLCRTESILIASNCYPTEIVRSKLLKLDYWHIEYVLNCLRENTTKVRNIKKYLLAALFNAPSTIDGYYTAEANHDTYVPAAGAEN